MDLITTPPVLDYEQAEIALVDLILRTQQCLLALDCYQTNLEGVNKQFPNMVMIGNETKDVDITWGSPKTAKDLIDMSDRAKQLVVLSCINLASGLTDTYMKNLAIKYWKANPPLGGDGKPDDSWYTPEAFEMVTGIQLSSLQDSEVIEEIRLIATGLRKFKKTRAVTIVDYFDYMNRLSKYLRMISQLAYVKWVADVKAKQIGASPNEPKPEEPKNGDSSKGFNEDDEQGFGDGEEFPE